MLSRDSALTEIARDPMARANLVAFGVLFVTAAVIAAAVVFLLEGRGEGLAAVAGLSFAARVLGAVGGLFLGLAFLVPAVSDAALGTALRIAYLAAGILVLIGLAILPITL